MHTLQISNELKDLLDRLVAQGFAARETEAVEQAVLSCAAGFCDSDDELTAAIEAGMADMRNGNFVTIDGPESSRAFWDDVNREVSATIAEMRSKATRSGT